MTEILNVKQEQYIVEVIWLRKFSTYSVDVKNQLFRSYISCLYCSALWLKFSTATLNMTRVAYNNVYRALMWTTRGYGHSISREYCTNNIDGFETVLGKMISSLRGWLHKSVNTVVASYVSSQYFMLSSPLCAKWNVEILIVRENLM